MKLTFAFAVLGAFTWFGKELWPYVKGWLDDRNARRRTEQLRLERERDRG